jgi:phospholipase/lecithinase/hemolysin
MGDIDCEHWNVRLPGGVRAFKLRALAAMLIVFAAGFSECVAAGPFSDLIVFGDSLSDVGNIQSAIGIYPGDGYFNGRFSNGSVYAEALSMGLGLGPLVRSTNSGDNFAYGGARTAGTGGLEGFFIRDQYCPVKSRIAVTGYDQG